MNHHIRHNNALSYATKAVDLLSTQSLPHKEENDHPIITKEKNDINKEDQRSIILGIDRKSVV